MGDSRLQPVWGDVTHQMARDLRVLIRDVLKTEAGRCLGDKRNEDRKKLIR